MEQIVDRAKFAQTKLECGGNFARIAGYFREDGAKAIAAIGEAMRQRNAAALVRPAHTLKGEALQFGAEPLGFTAETIEKAARQAVEDHQFPDAIALDVSRLEPLFHQTLAFFEREIGGGSPAAAPVRRVAAFGRKAVR